MFDTAHEERYGYASADEAAEIVSLRCSVIGEMPKPALERIPAGLPAPGPGARTGERPVYFTGQGFVATPTFDRRLLEAGNRIAGPALVEEYASTTVVPPGAALEVDPYGNLSIEVYAS